MALQCLQAFHFGRLATVFAMVGILIVLGCFMEQIAMMLLTLPILHTVGQLAQSRHVVAEHNPC